MEFANRLREVLAQKEMSQEQFGKKVGISRTAINNYCNGRREPSLTILVLICDALGETADFMLGRTKI